MRITTVPRTVKLAAAAFELQKAGLIFGWVFAAQQLGRATAAYGAGFARTLLLIYCLAPYTAGAACLLAAAMVMMIRRPGAPIEAPRIAPAAACGQDLNAR